VTLVTVQTVHSEKDELPTQFRSFYDFDHTMSSVRYLGKGKVTHPVSLPGIDRQLCFLLQNLQTNEVFFDMLCMSAESNSATLLLRNSRRRRRSNNRVRMIKDGIIIRGCFKIMISITLVVLSNGYQDHKREVTTMLDVDTSVLSSKRFLHI
jgi:hypothetical protein